MSTKFAGCRVVVMGLGRFGGGIGVSQWLARQGARVVVSDQADEAVLRDSIARLAGLGIEIRCGGHDPADLDGADLLVVSPAVDKRTSGFVREARRRGIPISSEMNLFFERCRGRIVGVTGTTGKSTTCAMLYEILQAATNKGELNDHQRLQTGAPSRERKRPVNKPRARAWGSDQRRPITAGGDADRYEGGGGLRPGMALERGHIWLGGNIGRSLLMELNEIGNDDLVVLELSSFMLDDLAAVGKSPPVAVITNAVPKHLDRHGSFAEYLACKLNICCYQQPGDVVVVGTDDPVLIGAVTEVTRQTGASLRTTQNSGLVPRPVGDGAEFRLKVLGPHNRRNAAVAAETAEVLGVDRETVREALAAFGGLPHRLQFVRQVTGVKYYNDSKSTSPEAVAAALSSFDRAVILIVGGQERHECWDTVSALREPKIAHSICLGEAGPALAGLLGGTAVATLEEAVSQARRRAGEGDVILFSPGCPSYDRFVNYEVRGETFVALVEEL